MDIPNVHILESCQNRNRVQRGPSAVASVVYFKCPFGVLRVGRFGLVEA